MIFGMTLYCFYVAAFYVATVLPLDVVLARLQGRSLIPAPFSQVGGIVAGLAARGAPALLAASWAVFLHGSAGRSLEKRMGTLGFLARELLDEVPRLMHGLAR